MQSNPATRTLQHAAARCSTLQHAAARCNAATRQRGNAAARQRGSAATPRPATQAPGMPTFMTNYIDSAHEFLWDDVERELCEGTNPKP